MRRQLPPRASTWLRPWTLHRNLHIFVYLLTTSPRTIVSVSIFKPLRPFFFSLRPTRETIRNKVAAVLITKRPHRCCHLSNKVEIIDHTPDILYLQWAGPPAEGIPAATQGVVHCDSRSPHLKRHLNRFSRFCTAHGCVPQIETQRRHATIYICNKMPHLCNAYVRCGLIFTQVISEVFIQY